MGRFALIGGLALLAAACGDNPVETAEAPSTPAPAAPAPALPAVDPNAPGYFDALSQFNPATQRFIWILPEGIHGVGPWTTNVTVKHKGEEKFRKTIPMKGEVVPPGTYPDFPATSEVIRITDDGQFASGMAEVNKVIQDLIAKHGRGDGELLMETPLITSIDPAYKQAYCVDKKPIYVRVFFEDAAETPPKLTSLSLGPVMEVAERSILENCAK